jgi:hypothetical protein
VCHRESRVTSSNPRAEHHPSAFRSITPASLSIMLSPITLLLLPAVAIASVKVQEPSDVIPPSQWAADNELISDYNAPFPANGQPKDRECHI